MDLSIRKLDLEERRTAMYQDAYDQIKDDLRAEYEAEFGPEFRAQHPFKPNHEVIHALVLKRLSQK